MHTEEYAHRKVCTPEIVHIVKVCILKSVYIVKVCTAASVKMFVSEMLGLG